MTRISKLHEKWMNDPEFRGAYAALDEEFALAGALIARTAADLTQEQLADRMHTTQGTIARLESGRGKPSTSTLKRFAEATGTRLKISFEPVEPGHYGVSGWK